MAARELADEVNRTGLYQKRDGSPVDIGQIHSRAQSYDRLFVRAGGGIRLRETAPAVDPIVSQRFDAAMLEVYAAAMREDGYPARRFLAMVRGRGGLEAARQLLAKPGISEGFRRLAEAGKLDLTMEYLVLTPSSRSSFPRGSERSPASGYSATACTKTTYRADGTGRDRVIRRGRKAEDAEPYQRGGLSRIESGESRGRNDKLMRRYFKDDQGYLTWLAAHPDGFVLNSYAHVTGAYLILHRAACRTINRPLPPPSRWTHPYPKTCSDDRGEIEAWALRETGKAVKPCSHCLPQEELSGVPRRPIPRTGAPGSRAPRPIETPVEFDGEPIRITVPRAGDADKPGLVLEGAQWLAETFFRQDPSAVGSNSYDAWIEATQTDPWRRDRVVDGDVTAVNTTMAARTSHAAWAPVIASTEWSWLEALDPTWDLFETPETDAEWAMIAQRLATAFAATKRPGLGLAVITKVLHIKRPRLIPVMDSVVIEQIGARVSDDVAAWVAAVGQVRAVGRGDLVELRAVRDHLHAKGMADRSLVRILDALLWVSSPGSGLFSSLTGWERVFRPRSD